MTSETIRPGATAADPWQHLRQRTPARIALGRTGASLPTREVLAFALAHAQARDAVHAGIDTEALATRVRALGLAPLSLDTDAPDRALYLRRPDYGRRLSAPSRARLGEVKVAPCDLALVIGDGLSSAAVMAHAAPLLAAITAGARAGGIAVSPTVAIVRGARVAVADEIGAVLGARLIAILIGERPGLSSPDSLGIYLTHRPKPGLTDAERNCISNVRPAGLPVDAAAHKLIWLAREALRRGLTGVALKDESGAFLPAGQAVARLGSDTP